MIRSLQLIQKQVVIFGTGFQAVKCQYFFAKKGIEIRYYLNNNPEIEDFCGKQVMSPSSENVKGVFIVVTGTENTYLTIKRQLQGMGLEEFKHFVYYLCLDKKIVFLHGNCHVTIIKEYLQSSKEFTNNCWICSNPLIHENKDGKVEDTILKYSDIWIHEDIRPDNTYGYYLSDDYIRKNCNSEVFEIVIPNLFGLGNILFPQAEGGNKLNAPISNGKDRNGVFPYQDIIIDRQYLKTKDEEQIVSFCKSDAAIGVEVIRENFNKCMYKIKEREKGWDIKIYDFINEQYKKCKLFYDPGHPTNVILKKISLDILSKLGIKSNDIFAKNCLDTHEIPVYPIVKKILQLEWDDNLVRNSDSAKKLIEKMDFEEYIKEYIWWCMSVAVDECVKR